jgi:hypothetical protein
MRTELFVNFVKEGLHALCIPHVASRMIFSQRLSQMRQTIPIMQITCIEPVLQQQQ